MADKRIEAPTVLIPYSREDPDCGCQDVFIYLRPETNGVRVESRIMRVVQQNPRYRDSIELVYLANLPGGFILEHEIVQRHYHVKVYFARQGGGAFTPYMAETFKRSFGIDPRGGQVLGAYEACEVLGYNEEELFSLWVPTEDMLSLCGQSIKRINDFYIVNYDIPAILSRNNINTDIAVMIFRTSLDYGDIHQMVTAIGNELHTAGLLNTEVPLARAFHYSKGPFEQILDAAGYLFAPDGKSMGIESSAFYQYLTVQAGFSRNEVLGTLRQPIFGFSDSGGGFLEEEIYLYTQGDSYAAAAEKLGLACSQIILP